MTQPNTPEPESESLEVLYENSKRRGCFLSDLGFGLFLFNANASLRAEVESLRAERSKSFADCWQRLRAQLTNLKEQQIKFQTMHKGDGDLIDELKAQLTAMTEVRDRGRVSLTKEESEDMKRLHSNLRKYGMIANAQGMAPTLGKLLDAALEDQMTSDVPTTENASIPQESSPPLKGVGDTKGQAGERSVETVGEP